MSEAAQDWPHLGPDEEAWLWAGRSGKALAGQAVFFAFGLVVVLFAADMVAGKPTSLPGTIGLIGATLGYAALVFLKTPNRILLTNQRLLVQRPGGRRASYPLPLVKEPKPIPFGLSFRIPDTRKPVQLTGISDRDALLAELQKACA